MIHIDKGTKIPKILSTGIGKKETDKLCADFDLAPAGYQAKGVKVTPAKKHVFKSRIYTHDDVKDALIKLQHNKCCFSEAKFNGDYGDVEHFRPKGRIGIEGSNVKIYPGYYWLAYSWDNLLLCKQVINQSHKKDFFPLENNGGRVLNHNEDYTTENPVLIDPSRENPRDHIRFHKEVPKGRTDQGKKTITLLNLRHSHFDEPRRTLFNKLKNYKELLGKLELVDPDCNTANFFRDELSRAIRPEAEYSSMAIDLLQNE